ncbi:hypothetical protein [Demequina zhanjiangensis]|uniref:Uncharacterized protein n=1 Tax=Demequina zhanjiangensis TaxID=3051659 RepID=A0ABT8G0G6_9MICO|nr:hypothetical protein [Demequina sp. SYSU T00b26]MDN4472204.1 hypothetical protein [Demequina sp. SYSU T00b26]
MAPDDDVQGGDSLLSALEQALSGAEEWRPGSGSDAEAAQAAVPLASLPGRRPGEALETRTHPAAGPRALIRDCGTSRHPGRTHVLLVSEQAPLVLATSFDRLGQAVADRLGSDGFAWEEGVHLHVTAPGRVWEDVLRTARDAVAELATPDAQAG